MSPYTVYRLPHACYVRIKAFFELSDMENLETGSIFKRLSGRAGELFDDEDFSL